MNRPTRLAVAAVDAYRARRVPRCSQCATDPARSASARVRDRLVNQGLVAGVVLFLGLWADRFSRGGW